MSTARKDHSEMIHEKTVEVSHLAIKATLLVNGGAAVTVIGFLSSVFKVENTHSNLLVSAADALMFFAWGLVTAIVTLALAYLTNYFSLSTWIDYQKTNHIMKRAFHVGAILSFFTSIGLFICGAYSVRNAFVGAIV
ncbi:hypothetical protein E1162_02450 [Rhodobacteraceae bacterium RKSG542]|uniref:hypothetical protein n=1 Tax=Pseudovibrio flavus TaxID=2529854 RepID=UPI0012BBACFF|nr:hypothetical protein [Pseudovibrio flavus]MTI16095.1 hypothetical protein [Pseudovibrio flavus]